MPEIPELLIVMLDGRVLGVFDHTDAAETAIQEWRSGDARTEDSLERAAARLNQHGYTFDVIEG